MNISQLLNDIKNSKGLNTIALPFDEPIEKIMMTSLANSVRTFSQFNHQKKDTIVAFKDLHCRDESDKRLGIYTLPPEVHSDSIFSASAEVESFNHGSPYAPVNENGSPLMGYGIGYGGTYPQDVFNGAMVGSAANLWIGQVTKKPTSQYMGNNLIRLFNFPLSCYVNFTVECEHDLSGESIPESCRESFKQLATYDICIFLYNNLRGYKGVGGGNARITLDIESWANMEAARDDLINKWNSAAHLDSTDSFMFF